MFSERMALEATLRRERLTSEAQIYRRLRPCRRARASRQAQLLSHILSHLGDWMVVKGTALQRRYRHAVEPAGRPNPATGGG